MKPGSCQFISLLTPDVDYNFPCKLFPRSSAPRNSQFSSAKCVINNAAESYTQNVTNFFALQASTLVFKANCNNFYQLQNKWGEYLVFEFLVASKTASISVIIRISVACIQYSEISSAYWLIVLYIYIYKEMRGRECQCNQQP